MCDAHASAPSPHPRQRPAPPPTTARADFKYGREVERVLPSFFFSELQARYGNMFNVRQEGEPAAVAAALDALTGCLRRGGCTVVPGIDADHYNLTLGASIAGGLVCGSALRLDPGGERGGGGGGEGEAGVSAGACLPQATYLAAAPAPPPPPTSLG